MAHPNIPVQYQGLPITEVNKIVPLGIQNGNAPDVFQSPSNITTGQMVKEGWVRPIDDLVPNFAQWKARFPTGTFVEGVTDFGGKTYAAPYLSAK